MAQLNAPVSDIQLKSGMLTTAKLNALTTTTEKEAAWTDDSTYPSAKAVADKIDKAVPDKFEHPIGSIIITSTNVNPTATIGGSWSLVDKSFKNATTTLGKDPSTPTSTAASGLSVVTETIIYTDHSLLLQLVLQVNTSTTITVANPLQNPVQLASLSIGNYGHYGVTQLSSRIANNIAFATPHDLAASSVICYSIDKDGKLWLNDVLNDGTGSGNATRKLAGGTRIYFNVVIPIQHTDIKDGYCDKFYWMRTA